MVNQEKKYDPISGVLGYEGGRVLNLNGLSIDVPSEGFAYVAIQLVPINGALMPCAREIKGSMAPRFGAMRFGKRELEMVKAQTAALDGGAVQFVYSFSSPRPKISRN